jgi:diguanylate cyclase (GGDEF)-like protein
LYVEDNKEAREAIGEMLSLLFDNVVSVVDGVEGLEEFKKSKFDLVISDIKMPRMDGVEMAKHIKMINPNMPVVMATAHQESEYLLDCIKYSVDGYLLKPINIEQLKEVLLKISEKLYCDMMAEDYESHLEELVKERTNELELAHKALMSMVNKDSMTGLYNRRYFNEVSNTLLSLAKRESKKLSALMVDIDHFKLINDTNGHIAGDDVIKEIANILLNTTRESDVVVRFGGEEFIILLPNTNIDGASLIAKKIKAIIEDKKLILEDKTEIDFTVSVGVAECDYEKDDDIDSLVHRVDVDRMRDWLCTLMVCNSVIASLYHFIASPTPSMR